MIPRWFIWTLAALLCWGVWAVLGRILGSAVSAGQSQAWSTLGTLPVLLIIALAKRPAPAGNPNRGRALGFAAGLLTAAGNLAYFAALSSGAKAATVIPLTALYPLVTIVLAVGFLREKLNPVQYAGIALALAAIYLFNISDDSGFLSPTLTVAVLPILLWGVSGLFQKLSTNHVSGESSTLFFLLAFIPVAIVLALREPFPSDASTRTWTLVLLLGFSFAAGNYCILQAFARDGKASVIAPLAGLYPMVSLPIVIAVLRERIAFREAFGIALSLAAVAAIAVERPAPTNPSNIPQENQ